MTASRVTNSQIASRLDSFIETEQLRHDAIQEELKKQGQQTTAILDAVQKMQIGLAVANTERETMKKKIDDEINRLDKRVNGWSATNSIGALIAIILGYLGINR